MPHDAKKYLHDMREACRRVQEFTASRSLTDYQSDPLLRSAVERQFQILGEAMAQLDRHHPEVAKGIPDHRAIINFRHVLVHGYDVVEDDVVWGIAEGRIAALIRKLAELLEEE